jgi:hypothetical protein
MYFWMYAIYYSNDTKSQIPRGCWHMQPTGKLKIVEIYKNKSS